MTTLTVEESGTPGRYNVKGTGLDFTIAAPGDRINITGDAHRVEVSVTNGRANIKWLEPYEDFLTNGKFYFAYGTIYTKSTSPKQNITSDSFDAWSEGGGQGKLWLGNGQYYYYLDSHDGGYGIMRHEWSSGLTDQVMLAFLSGATGYETEDTTYFTINSNELAFSYHFDALTATKTELYITKYSGTDLVTREVIDTKLITRTQDGVDIINEYPQGIYSSDVNGNIRVLYVSTVKNDTNDLSPRFFIYDNTTDSVLLDTVPYNGEGNFRLDIGNFYGNKYVVLGEYSQTYGEGGGRYVVAFVVDLDAATVTQYNCGKTWKYGVYLLYSAGVMVDSGRLYFIYQESILVETKFIKLAYFDLEDNTFNQTTFDMTDEAVYNPGYAGFVQGRNICYFFVNVNVGGTWYTRFYEPDTLTTLFDVANGDCKLGEWASNIDSESGRIWRYNGTEKYLEGFDTSGNSITADIEDLAGGTNLTNMILMFNDKFIILTIGLGGVLTAAYRYTPV
jgi:hypothetical protein